jgi:hypothetical protein
MATRFTYPGVYLEEIESAVRPIVGVDTSVAAFVGLALEGPRTPTTINSWTEYDSTFGGLWTGSELSYAVYQFFLNGGAKAIVVRVGADIQYATIDLGDSVKLRARTPGTAGNALTATVKHDPADSKHYTLTIKVSGKASETYEISIDAALRGRWLDRALETSRLVGPADGSPVDRRPAEGDKTVTQAADVTLAAADVIGDPVRRTGIRPVPPGRLPGQDGSGGVLRQVRQGEHPAGRHRRRRRQRGRRLPAAETRRVRAYPDPAEASRRLTIGHSLGATWFSSPSTPPAWTRTRTSSSG